MGPRTNRRHRRPRHSATRLLIVRAALPEGGPVRSNRLVALASALVATLAALWLQNVLRDVWQIRSLPERVEEWLLLFVPLDLFERGLAAFGASAKEFALVGAVGGMAALLVGIGI